MNFFSYYGTQKNFNESTVIRLLDAEVSFELTSEVRKIQMLFAKSFDILLHYIKVHTALKEKRIQHIEDMPFSKHTRKNPISSVQKAQISCSFLARLVDANALAKARVKFRRQCRSYPLLQDADREAIAQFVLDNKGGGLTVDKVRATDRVLAAQLRSFPTKEIAKSSLGIAAGQGTSMNKNTTTAAASRAVGQGLLLHHGTAQQQQQQRGGTLDDDRIVSLRHRILEKKKSSAAAFATTMPVSSSSEIATHNIDDTTGRKKRKTRWSNSSNSNSNSNDALSDQQRRVVETLPNKRFKAASAAADTTPSVQRLNAARENQRKLMMYMPVSMRGDLSAQQMMMPYQEGGSQPPVIIDLTSDVTTGGYTLPQAGKPKKFSFLGLDLSRAESQQQQQK
jgi:hypothetical protein